MTKTAPIVIVGTEGRMSKIFQELCHEKNLPYLTWSRSQGIEVFDQKKPLRGVIDFSLPAAQERVASLCERLECPWISGVSGWHSWPEAEKIFRRVSQKVPVVWDLNFSRGVEIFCQWAEQMASFEGARFSLRETHHIHKKDSPSGTALKLQKRLLARAPHLKIPIESIREGEVFGIHELKIELPGETLEIRHQAESRQVFAEGALLALMWAERQKPGFYSMQDVLK